MKSAEVLIVGQGLAGTVLGWSLTRAGIEWRMIDAGHERAASRVAAGIINPVTGQRWVKTWRIEELWPETRTAYLSIEQELGVTLWREMRIRRYWRTDKERRVLGAKCARGDLDPYVTAIDHDSCVLAPAARVDVQTMLVESRRRWLKEGRLTEGWVEWRTVSSQDTLTIDCTGAAASRGPFGQLSWAVSKGEVLRIAAPDLAPDTILHRGHWLLPVEQGDAWIGATHEPGVDDLQPTSAARDALLASAAKLTGQHHMPTQHMTGLRLAADDMRPVVGRHPDYPLLGLIGGLGSKGVLYAPWLARQWVEQLLHDVVFDQEVGVGRYFPA
uniref:NAD(P)/FAD-dependent oxidoreductase n=1 Tax=Cephaloticoccus sp. TaxID=1985742 RepID=UPI00404A7A97